MGLDDHVSRVRALYDDGGDPTFRAVVASVQPADGGRLAEVIEVDGRLRLALGRDVTLDRYLEVAGVEDDNTALDAAIEMALRAASRRRVPGRRDVEAMVQNYPHLEQAIREAVMLALAVPPTTTFKALSNGEAARRLPFELGPLLADGRPRYELLELVGEGATGGVYRAVDRNLSDGDAAATVAVKIFSPHTDPALGAWMREEALKARRVVHENVVRALDRGDLEDGSSYIVYEFVAGGDLGDRIRRERLPMRPRSAARLLSGTARGVQAIHAAGLVHCDLKPGNIALTPEGRPKVADFGIAMREGQAPSVLGETVTTVGTLAFTAPEQFRGDAGAFSFPADIYALGAMLAYLVSGRLPHKRALLTDSEAPADPGVVELDDAFDPDLRRIVSRATAVEPGDRYASASEFADDLDRWVQRRPLPWGRTGARRRTMLFVRRRPVLAAFAAIALVGASTAAAIKIREDLRRATAVRIVEDMIMSYATGEIGIENLPSLTLWQSIAHMEYFDGLTMARGPDQVETYSKLLGQPDIASRPDGFDALMLRSALAVALAAEGEFERSGPIARDCRKRWAAAFGADDSIVFRMRVVEAVAAAERLHIGRAGGAAPPPDELEQVLAVLTAAEVDLPERHPLRRLAGAQKDRLQGGVAGH